MHFCLYRHSDFNAEYWISRAKYFISAKPKRHLFEVQDQKDDYVTIHLNYRFNFLEVTSRGVKQLRTWHTMWQTIQFLGEQNDRIRWS